MSEDAPRIIRNVAVPLGSNAATIKAAVARQGDLDAQEILEIRPIKLSLDARKGQPQHIYTVAVWLRGEDPPVEAPIAPRLGKMKSLRAGEAPIIVGAGPAGLWAALRFIEAGQPCILLDRGGAMTTRHKAVVGLRRHGKLNPENNLCFGEGGAGTYSDGKLYTRKKDPNIMRIYRDLIAFGAQEDILFQAHPHVGTNRLVRVLDALRIFLMESGCELRFEARVDGLLQDTKGKICGVRLEDGEELTAPGVIFATGHSARDTYQWLHDMGVPMAPKSLAIGARVEHPQALIDRIQYGGACGHSDLEAATYAVTARIGQRGVYSFCMCPGGFVIPTPVEPEHLNVNGMSSANRGSDFANSALVVTVDATDFYLERPGDLDHLGPLKGIAFQRSLEAAAYEAGGGGYRAPAQRLTDFLDDRPSQDVPRSSYRPGITATSVRQLLPRRLHDPLARSLLHFDKKMPGFLTAEAILIGLETTTSSPVRIARDDATMTPPDFPGFYPCGEGAGRAGGIVSSALEGLLCAEALLSTLP
jgi:uncharacterized FAD-dependent dehydrogenase